jgi:hypothetical protein
MTHSGFGSQIEKRRGSMGVGSVDRAALVIV